MSTAEDCAKERGRRGGLKTQTQLSADSFDTEEGSDILTAPLKAQEPSRTVILHYSPLKSAWDWLVLVLVLYVALITPYMTAFNQSSKPTHSGKQVSRLTFARQMFSDGFLQADLAVDSLFFIDMILNFRTTFLRDGELVVNPSCIAIKYLKGWFVIDFLSAIPFDLIVNLYRKSETATATGLMKTARLLRLFRVARKMDHYSEYGASLLILFMALITLLAHWLACAFYLLAVNERPRLQHPIGWLDELALKTGMPYHPNDTHSGPDTMSKYVTALYFTFTILTSVGFGNVAAVTDLEKTFSIAAMVIGSLANAAIFGNVATIMHRMYRGNKQFHDQSSGIKDFVKLHRIPGKLAIKLHLSNQEQFWKTNGVDMDEVLSSFPEGMQADVSMHLNKPLLTSTPAFQTASPGCLRLLSVHMTPCHTPPGETFLHQNDIFKSLFFVTKGCVEISKDSVIVAILTKGDIFGPGAGKLAGQSVSYRSRYSVRALSHCHTHRISLQKLKEVFELYPEFAREFFKTFVATFDISSSGDDEDLVKSIFSMNQSPTNSDQGSSKIHLLMTPSLPSPTIFSTISTQLPTTSSFLQTTSNSFHTTLTSFNTTISISPTSVETTIPISPTSFHTTTPISPISFQTTTPISPISLSLPYEAVKTPSPSLSWDDSDMISSLCLRIFAENHKNKDTKPPKTNTKRYKEIEAKINKLQKQVDSFEECLNLHVGMVFEALED